MEVPGFPDDDDELELLEPSEDEEEQEGRDRIGEEDEMGRADTERARALMMPRVHRHSVVHQQRRRDRI